MPTNITGNSLALERGIEGISHLNRNNGDYDLWPERRSLPPPSQGVKAHLAELLNTPDTARYLYAVLQPTITNPELLLPAKFHAILAKALKDLRTTAAKKDESSRTINRAVRLLNEEVGLRELAQMYRSALYQG